MLLHCLFQASHVPIDISVEQPKKETKILRIAFMWSGRHQQVVVRAFRQCFADLIGKRLFVGAVRPHLMRFVDHDQVPATTEETLVAVLHTRYPCDSSSYRT